MTIPVKVAIGRRFGRLEVVRVVPGHKVGPKRSCVCRCKCGKRKTIAVSALLSNRTRSCGCWMRESARTRKLKNIVGVKFSRLVALRRLPGGSSDGAVWLCQCRCGKTTKVSIHKLMSGNTKSCGCLHSETSRMQRGFRNLKGKRFGRLVALRLAGTDGHHHRVWLCKCDCGKKIKTSVGCLLRRHSRSCGCLKRDVTRVRNTTHGRSHTPEYIAFHSAIARCTLKTNRGFADYGGRGIRFLFKSFPQFLKHLGLKPAPEYSLDRFPNNDGHYEPGNVRWATRKQQNNNRRAAKPRVRKAA